MKEVDITKNELVPKQSILNENEKQEMLNKYKITLRQLPRISLNDPVVKILDGKPGDVVKIVRNSQVAGEYVYYRVVIKS